MCNAYCIIFAAINIKNDEIKDKRVIEVGSKNVNGSYRELLESYYPREYVGVDVADGPGVDFVCNAEDLLQSFQKESFDVLVSTEMLEHVRNWKLVISNFKNLVRSGGKIVITTRSYGFPYHGYPYDFWRYELEDFKEIFSDCMIERLERDPGKGVFAKIVKPKNFVENNLSDYELYSMIAGKRVKRVSNHDIQVFFRRMEMNRRLSSIKQQLKMVGSLIEKAVIR
jgi:2-polyprenyl-3-methyl-5-hydroxy-6-metoxy-1,4-benzoquinol methylase